MLDIASENPATEKPRRPWNQHGFYMSDQMAAVAKALADREKERTGRRTGAGQIVDRAMRRYVSELMAPDELAALLNGHNAAD